DAAARSLRLDQRVDDVDLAGIVVGAADRDRPIFPRLEVEVLPYLRPGRRYRLGAEPGLHPGDQRLLPEQALDLPDAEPAEDREPNDGRDRRPDEPARSGAGGGHSYASGRTASPVMPA